jgi:hypothetical protein
MPASAKEILPAQLVCFHAVKAPCASRIVAKKFA